MDVSWSAAGQGPMQVYRGALIAPCWRRDPPYIRKSGGPLGEQCRHPPSSPAAQPVGEDALIQTYRYIARSLQESIRFSK